VFARFLEILRTNFDKFFRMVGCCAQGSYSFLTVLEFFSIFSSADIQVTCYVNMQLPKKRNLYTWKILCWKYFDVVSA